MAAEHTPGGGLGRAHLRVIDNVSAKTLTKAAGAMIEPGSTVKTDGWRAYRSLPNAGYGHEPHVQATPQAAGELLPWVHIVISNFKRWQLDVFHGVSAAHLQSYLDEYCYRLNRRDAARRHLPAHPQSLRPVHATDNVLSADRAGGLS